MKKILIVSYFSNDGSANSEWVLDKVYAFEKLGFKVDIVTSMRNETLKNRKGFVRVPSLSPTISYNELRRNLQHNIVLYLIFFPAIISIGLISEAIERIILGRIGHGMWSWFPSTMIYLLIFKIFIKYDFIYSCGGPPSAYLASIVYSKLSRTRLIIDLQDHLVGSDIGSKVSAPYLEIVEKFIVKHANKVNFHMKSTLISAQARYPNNTNLFFSYTSSRRFMLKDFKAILPHNGVKFKAIHLGTIYSNRNFLSLEKIIDEASKKTPNLFIEITNLGYVTIENKKINSKNFKLKIIDSIPRVKAVRSAIDFDFLILIQHIDDRSLNSFPFKVWDYLNLNVPIFALINNDELETILRNHGHYVSNIHDKNNSVSEFLSLINDLKNGNIEIISNTFDLIQQTRELIREAS